ncbi:MAG TPA: SRPBCC family protein [Candidatus Dormibacteraeota bacterium]|nr:SRPBCC family protein [Candidatus Dormibacteraeota bacterium]
MKFSHSVEIPAPPDRVYAFLLDVPRVANCLPGARDVRESGDGRYAGGLGVAVGPIRVALDGEVAILARDDAARSLTLRAIGEDRRAGGIRANIAMHAQHSGQGTRLLLDSEVQVHGRLGDLGRPIMKRKADQLIVEFARNVARELGA